MGGGGGQRTQYFLASSLSLWKRLILLCSFFNFCSLSRHACVRSSFSFSSSAILSSVERTESCDPKGDHV